MYLEKIVKKAYKSKLGIDARPHQVTAFLAKADELLEISVKIAGLPRDVYFDSLEGSVHQAPQKGTRKAKSKKTGPDKEEKST